MNKFGKYLVILLALLLFAGEAGAKSYGSSRSSFGGGSSFRSTPSKSSWSAPKSTPSAFKPAQPAYTAPKPVTPTPVAPTPTPIQVNKGKTSSFATTGAVAGGTVATGAVVTSSNTNKNTSVIDAKLAKQSATTGKTYASKSDAESAYRTKLASQNTYTSSREPATRPEYVPRNVSVSGRNVNVVYHSIPGGGYGYGYYDPMTHMFMTMAATQMIMNASRQSEIDHMYEQQMIAQQQSVIAQQQAVINQQQNGIAPQQVVVNHPVVPQQSGHSVWFYLGITVLVVGAVVLFFVFVL